MKKLLIFLGLVVLFVLPFSAKAKEVVEPEFVTLDDSDIDERGLYVEIGVSLYQENGRVYAEATNRFTFGVSTVYTVVILYSSETYTEDVEQMTFEAYNSTNDLNIWQSISCSVEYDGPKYWCARVRYKNDSDPWKAEVTGTEYF